MWIALIVACAVALICISNAVSYSSEAKEIGQYAESLEAANIDFGNEITEKDAHIAELEAELRSEASSSAIWEAKNDGLLKMCEERDEKLATLTAEKEALAKEIEGLKVNYDNAIVGCNALDDRCLELQSTINRLTTENQSLEETALGLTDEVESLKSDLKLVQDQKLAVDVEVFDLKRRLAAGPKKKAQPARKRAAKVPKKKAVK